MSDKFITGQTTINWRALIGQQNIIAHEYGQSDYELLYRTVSDDIPVLIRQLEQILPDAIEKHSGQFRSSPAKA